MNSNQIKSNQYIVLILGMDMVPFLSEMIAQPFLSNRGYSNKEIYTQHSLSTHPLFTFFQPRFFKIHQTRGSCRLGKKVTSESLSQLLITDTHGAVLLYKGTFAQGVRADGPGPWHATLFTLHPTIFCMSWMTEAVTAITKTKTKTKKYNIKLVSYLPTSVT